MTTGKARHLGLVIWANLAAAVAWACAPFVRELRVLLADLAATDGIGMAVAVWITGATVAVAAFVGVVALAFTIRYAVPWARDERQPLLPGLSLAHALLAWGLGTVYVIARW